MDNVSIFSIPSSSRWLINCSVKTCQALKSTEDISVLMITDFAGFDWSPRLEEEISIDLGPGAMICYCHRTTRRFEKRAELEFETKNAFLKCGKFTNSIEHYKICCSQKSLRKSHKSLVKNNTLMINRCSLFRCKWGVLVWDSLWGGEVPRCQNSDSHLVTAPLAALSQPNYSSMQTHSQLCQRHIWRQECGCKNIAKGTTKQSVNCAVSIFISPFILFKSWYHECMHTLALSRGNICGEFCVWVWILTPPSNVDGFYNNQKEWSDCTKIER